VDYYDPLGLKTVGEWLWGPGGGNVGAGIIAAEKAKREGTFGRVGITEGELAAVSRQMMSVEEGLGGVATVAAAEAMVVSGAYAVYGMYTGIQASSGLLGWMNTGRIISPFVRAFGILAGPFVGYQGVKPGQVIPLKNPMRFERMR